MASKEGQACVGSYQDSDRGDRAAGKFGGADPANAPPVFISVGSFREKKAPQLTIAAFSHVHHALPAARLRMIGEGALLDECKNLANDLGVAGAITFLGVKDHAVVEEEMRQARCFVQHSVVARSGDSEGTPVAVLEAGATGLPVVSTLHAGIPDVVIEGQTGFLVAEHDVEGMAERMLRLAQDAELAGRWANRPESTSRIIFLWTGVWTNCGISLTAALRDRGIAPS